MDFNRSDRQTDYQDRELIEAVLSKTEERLNDSGGSRLSSLVLPRASLRSTGNLSRPASFVSHGSRRSVTLSQDKLTDSNDEKDFAKETRPNYYHEIQLHIVVMIQLCVSSLFLGLFTILILIGLSAQQQTIFNDRIRLIDFNKTLMTVTEVATALSMFVVVCDVTCLLVCSLQCIVVMKLIQQNLGDER